MRRKARRYQFGAYLKGTGTRLRGLVSVAEIPWCHVRRTSGEPVTLLTIRFVDRISLEARFPVRACDGAEKSCRTRRRKRGLRKGKDRSRGRHPRCISPGPANVSKSQSSRKVNHIGRKFIWAVKASNRLRKDCEKLNKFPRGELGASHPAYRARRNMKCYCLAKWTRLHKQAEVSGIPPVAAFHTSFWKYLLVETSRGNKAADWDMLLTGLPRREPSRTPVESSFGDLFSQGLSLGTSGEISFKKN